MPIEIRELVIRAVVADETADIEDDRDHAEDDRADIVDAAVREVLRILQRSKER